MLARAKQCRRANLRRHCFAITALAGLAIGSMAAAHDFWIQPSRFWIAPGGATSIAILVGHGPARQRWVLRLNRVVGLVSVGPNGRRIDQSDRLSQGTYAPDAELTLADPGVHVVAFQNRPTVNELPAIRFNSYLAAEGIRPAIEWRQRTGTADQPGREVYSRRAKALVQVGAPTGARQPQVTRSLGMALEIIPAINPYSPRTARNLPILVVYHGRPLSGAFVKLTNLDNDARPVETHLSDGHGRAVFGLPKSGNWQFNVVWTRPLKDNPAADFETTFSSLTFGFSPGAG